jgi:polyphosphate kinase
VAPRDMRGQLIDLIEHETGFGSEGRISAKLNSLGDPELVEALYEASRAGVQVDLVVRGICRLVPGVAGVSDNIRVRSILGRYLEHSRIVRFAHGEDDGPLFLIGSADWMPRNLDRRIEVLVPVTHPKHQAWFDEVFNFALADDIVRWEMDAEGCWQRRGPESFTDGDSQERFYHWVTDRQKR